jgi:hypothetical protein
MDFRNEVRQAERDTRFTIFRFLPLFLVVLVILAGAGFGLRSLGIIGKTAVEREVFERSYQRSESLKARIATDQAVLAEIEGKLLNPNLDASTRFNLEAQASAARVRIRTAENQK